MILAIDTVGEMATVSLYGADRKQIASKQVPADRTLSESLLRTIDSLYNESKMNRLKTKKVVVYNGPGSFTGIRIGVTIANTIAQSLNIPIGSSGGDKKDWFNRALLSVEDAETFSAPAICEYGSAPNITKPKK